MAILSVWHPEIEEFIKAKQTPGRLTKFNMSVGVTSGFMEAVVHDKNWKLRFPDTDFEKYAQEWDGDLEKWESKNYPTKVIKTLKARELWDLITYSTYTRNEPGVLFLDLFNKLNPLAYAETISASNPCGEIGMATGVCDLGSLNLVKFIKLNDKNRYEFDFDTYAKAVKLAVRYLDNINDISRTPLQIYKDSVIAKRRIGLGNMGLGSLHFILGIAYGSKESLHLVKLIYKIKAETELIASAELGKEKGSFALFDNKKYFSSYWWNNLKIDNDVKTEIESIGCMRNSHHSMNAPNGNSSIYAGLVTGGIEPVFLKEYVRWSIVNEHEQRILKEKGLKFPNPLLGEWFETDIFKFTKRGDEIILSGQFDGINYEIDKNRGLVKGTLIEDYGWTIAKQLPNFKELEEQNVFKTTADLDVKNHTDVLGIVAHYTNMNNSKTTNVPANYSYEDFKSLYMSAWKAKIKGITTYRAGTMTTVLEAQRDEVIKKQTELEQVFSDAGDNIISNVTKLPNEYYSKGYILKDSNKKKWYINIAFIDETLQKPFALFVHSNCKEGSEVTHEFIQSMEHLLLKKGIDKELVEKQIAKYHGQQNTTKIARIIGMALRHNISIVDIVLVLETFDIQISSFMFHLKKLLSKFIPVDTKLEEACPTCKAKAIVYQEGCKTCLECGWSKC